MAAASAQVTPVEHRLKRPARWACSPEDVLSRRREEGAPRRHVPLVAIEAIIGAGKSTLLEQVKAHFGDAVVVVHEPVDVWTDVDGHNLLERYYKDQRRWGFSFQTFALFSRLQAVRTALAKVTPATRAVVMERSWLSDRLCFASLLHDDASMDGLEEAMHRKIFEWGLQNDSWPRIDGFVYLDVDLHVAQQRVAKRGRSEESAIPDDYQARLLGKHRDWIRSISDDENSPHRILNLNASMNNSKSVVDGWMERIERFVEDLCCVPLGGGVVAQAHPAKVARCLPEPMKPTHAPPFPEVVERSPASVRTC